MLPDGKTEDMFAGRKLEPEAPGVVAQLLLVDQLQGILGVGIWKEIIICSA